MNEKRIVFIIIFCSISAAICSANLIVEWSAWTDCSSSARSSCLTRSLYCRTNVTSWQRCRHGNSSVEEQLLNCVGCNGTWIDLNDKNESCVPTCYNSSRWQTSTCSSPATCIRRSRISCNNLSLCLGMWTTASVSTCDATCGVNGTQLLSENCLKHNKPSVECAGSYGLIKQRNISKVCMNVECNAWSEWSNTGACSTSCGNGMQYLTRKCLSNDTCSEPKGIEIKSQTCNNHSCPSWTPWSPGERCMNNIQAMSRVCLYLESVHSDCNGSKDNFFQTSLQTCYSTSNQSLNSDLTKCDDVLLSFTIPLIVGLLVCFGILVTTMVLFRNRCDKDSLQKDGTEISGYSGKQRNSRHSYRESTTQYRNEENNKSNMNARKMSIKDSFGSHNNINDGNFNCFGPHFSSLETSTEEHLNDSNANFPSRLNNTEFHRFASFPNILQEKEKQDKKQSLNDQLVAKKRPSVRRAERMKKKEQQREKRLRRRLDETDGLEWRRTQTLHQISSKQDHLKNRENLSILTHKKAHSAGSVLDSGYSPTSFTPLKPTRRSTKRLQDSSETLQRKHFSSKPRKPRRTSSRKLNPPVIWYQEADKDFSTVDSTFTPMRERSRSEGNLFQSSSKSLDSFKKLRANSINKNEGCQQDLRNTKSLSRPHKPRRNPSFYGTSFEGDTLGSRSSNLLHPNSSLHNSFRSGYHSSRSLQSVAEDATNDDKNKHKSMPVE